MTTKIILTQVTTNAGQPIEVQTNNSLSANTGVVVAAADTTISPFLLAGM
jgi:hypothetical protein